MTCLSISISPKPLNNYYRAKKNHLFLRSCVMNVLRTGIHDRRERRSTQETKHGRRFLMFEEPINQRMIWELRSLPFMVRLYTIAPRTSLDDISACPPQQPSRENIRSHWRSMSALWEDRMDFVCKLGSWIFVTKSSAHNLTTVQESSLQTKFRPHLPV